MVTLVASTAWSGAPDGSPGPQGLGSSPNVSAPVSPGAVVAEVSSALSSRPLPQAAATSARTITTARPSASGARGALLEPALIVPSDRGLPRADGSRYPRLVA